MTDREGPIHRSILAYLRLHCKGAVIHHSPNEFPGKGAMVASAISKAKQNGMVVGFPDLIMFWRGHCFGFEVKAPRGTVPQTQKDTLAALEANGVTCAVVRSIDDVKGVLAAHKSAGAVSIPLRGVVT